MGDSVLRFKHRLIGAITLSSVVAGVAFGQVSSHRDVQQITVHVLGDRDHSIPHTILIDSLQPYASPSETPSPRPWSARRVSDRGVDLVTAEDCPAVDEAVRTFQVLRSAPPPRMVGGTMQIEPTMKDGFSTHSVVLSGGVSTEVSGGSYAIWGHHTVSRLLACWEPLIPDTSSRYWERNEGR